jgi:hypothetical protein
LGACQKYFLTARQLSNLPEFPKSEGENRHLATLVAAERERERERKAKEGPNQLVSSAKQLLKGERQLPTAATQYSLLFSSLLLSSLSQSFKSVTRSLHPTAAPGRIMGCTARAKAAFHDFCPPAKTGLKQLRQLRKF